MHYCLIFMQKHVYQVFTTQMETDTLAGNLDQEEKLIQFLKVKQIL